MITKFGKRFLTNFVAGNSSFSSKEMAIGIANGSSLEYPLSDTNSRLGFEFYRVPIRVGGIDIDSSVSPVKYTRNLYESKFISNFELPYQWSPEPSLDQTNYRVGDSSLIFTSNAAVPREYTYILDSMDISGYNPSDTLSFSYKANDANLSSLKVRLYSSNTDYLEFTFTGHSVGYNIKNLNMSTGVSTGTFNPQSVVKLGIIVTPTTAQTSVSMDGLRINDEDTFDPEYGLIARSILDSTMIKVIGREASIEFKLDMSFVV
jgi:hypothetical protein